MNCFFFNKKNKLNIIKIKKKYKIFYFSANFYIFFSINYKLKYLNKNLNYFCFFIENLQTYKKKSIHIFFFEIFKFFINNKNFKIKKTQKLLTNYINFSHNIYFLLKNFFFIKFKKYNIFFIKFHKKNIKKIFSIYKLNKYSLKGVKNYKSLILKKNKL